MRASMIAAAADDSIIHQTVAIVVLAVADLAPVSAGDACGRFLVDAFIRAIARAVSATYLALGARLISQLLCSAASIGL